MFNPIHYIIRVIELAQTHPILAGIVGFVVLALGIFLAVKMLIGVVKTLSVLALIAIGILLLVGAFGHLHHRSTNNVTPSSYQNSPAIP